MANVVLPRDIIFRCRVFARSAAMRCSKSIPRRERNPEWADVNLLTVSSGVSRHAVVAM